uniref:Serpin peptidase inhibitor, clade E (nexin, plasminogen activator inhibitor type 1), member 3 n=1 Tax=Poecilia reticulata TaxID=8081 RepID=A0A3P9N677_POERE
MRRLPLASVFVFLWLAERSHCTGSFQDSMRELHNRFAVSFYQTLTEAENRSNLIASPASVSLSLALLQLGARGNTRAQLEGTLGYNMDIFLPRFRMQNKFSLRSVLPALGVSDAFNPTAADFTGISVEEGLYVSDAVHEVRIEVTEDGTKAAAATVFIIPAMVLLKRSRAPVFKADRPFLFLLRQVNTGSILFMGRIMNPADQVM